MLAERHWRLGLIATLFAALILAVVAIGCGGDDDTTGGSGTAEDFPPQIVTDDDIDAQEDGSPGESLLEWWQAFQFQDAAGVLALTSEDTIDELGEKELEQLVKTRGAGLQGVELLGASETGDTASVRAGLLTFQPPAEGEPPPDEPTASRPISFAMLREGDQWLYDDPTFLQPMIDSMLQAEQDAQDGQDGQGDK
jgi:hypothetical protein